MTTSMYATSLQHAMCKKCLGAVHIETHYDGNGNVRVEARCPNKHCGWAEVVFEMVSAVGRQS